MPDESLARAFGTGIGYGHALNISFQVRIQRISAMLSIELAPGATVPPASSLTGNSHLAHLFVLAIQ